MKQLFYRVIAWVTTLVMMIGGVFSGANHWDTIRAYQSRVESIGMFENTMDTALPQTKVYDLIRAHLASPLPEGKTEKKIIVIGYDGCRADTLTLSQNADESTIASLVQDGGHAVLSYCGGVNYPYLNTQDTSTAPGWCSMLTGEWADVHGITDNGIVKSNDHLTLLTTLVEDGTIDASAFYVSWPGHFSQENSTYRLEKEYIEEKGLNARFVCADGDDGTIENVLRDLSAGDCSDFIFSIMEHTDHEGHSTGFGQNNPKYADAFRTMEKAGKGILDAVQARDTYDSEDWLILVTTDHGGYNRGHGRSTMMERYTFIVSNKAIA